MANDVTTWIPPEAKQMSSVVRYGLMGGVALGGLYAFNHVAPTLVDAITLVDTIFQDGTHMMISGAVAFGTVLVLRETFSSTGKINQLLRLPYWIAIRYLTRLFITIDPFATIDERIKQVEDDEQLFDQQTAKVSAIVARLREQENDCRQKSLTAQKMGIAAHQRGLKDVEDLKGHEFGQYRDTADTLAAMRAKLEPMLATFQRIAQACKSTADKLKIERQTIQIKWDAQQAVSGAVASANRILGRSKTQVWNMAEQAADIVNTKYGEELGHLDHLKLVTEPLMDSIDLENATYNEDMLAAVQATGAKLLQATAATPLPAPMPTDQANAVVAGFIR